MTQPTTVYLLLMDMVKHEQNFGAYRIYLALTKGYLQKHDPIESINDVPFTDAELEELKRMEQQDVLGINRIKLYATQVDEKSTPSTLPKTPSLHKSYTNSTSVTSP